MATLLAELDPAVYVLDCLPDMSPQEVSERVEPFVRHAPGRASFHANRAGGRSQLYRRLFGRAKRDGTRPVMRRYAGGSRSIG